MSAAGIGGFAGGLASGLEAGQRIRRDRERDKREDERWGLEKRERERQAADRDAQGQAWSELNDLIQSRTGARAGTPGINPAPAPVHGGSMPTDQDTAQAFPLREPGAEPAAPVETPQAAEPTLQPRADMADPGKQIGFGLYQNPSLLRDPEFLNQAASIFLKAKMPEGLKWLERGYAAQKENAIDALRALTAGDAQRAVAAFNASGNMRVADLQPDPEQKGRWVVTMEGGGSRSIDPAQELKSYLDPKEWFALQGREADASFRREDLTFRRGEAAASAKRRDQERADTLRYRQDTLEETKRHNREQEGINRTRAGGAGGRPMTEKDLNALNARVQSQLRAQMRDTAPTDPLGKKQPNPLSEFVPDISERIMEDVRSGVDPATAFNNRYAEAGERFDQASTALDAVFNEGKKAGSGWTGNKDKSVKALRAGVQNLIEQGMTPEEIKRYAKAMRRDGAELKMLDEALRGMAGGQVARPGGKPGPQAAGPKEGDRKTVGGVTYVWRNGRPVPVQEGQ